MAVNRSSGGGSRPTSRERNSSSSSSRGTERRGGGLNLGGPVGNSGGYEDRPTGGGRSRGGADYSVSAISRGFDATEQCGGGIDASKFVWSKNSSGQRVLKLTDDEWDMIDTVKLNVFIDDGEGYIDLGLDPLFDFDNNGDLIGEFDGTWLCIDRYPAAFYHLITIENGGQYRIIGYVPAFLNDQHVNIIPAFNNANPKGYIAGAKAIESGPGTDLTVEQMVSDLIEVKAGDKVDFVCDYYDYDGVFINNYFFGEQMTVSSSPEIKNYKISGELSVCYRLEDYSGNHYWMPLID